jgi:hypothetical protein
LDPAMLLSTGAINQSITVSAGGTGYVAASTTVAFTAAPAGGTTATGFAVVTNAGVVQGVVVTNQGSGYTAAPTVTISGVGTGATATATLVTANSPLIAGQTLFWKNTGFAGANVYTVTNIQTLNTPNIAGYCLNPNATPGNWTWIQVAGRTNALVDAASGAIIPGTALYFSAATGTSNGSVNATAGTAATFAGISEGYLAATQPAGSTVVMDISCDTFRF